MDSDKQKLNHELELLNLKDIPKGKKINFFVGMLIVIGSSIGAGIFFKSHEILHYNSLSLILAILSWSIASIAIILLAIGLLEVVKSTNGNLSYVGWNKKFNTRVVYQMSRNFTLYLNIPLTFFFMPLYALMSFQDGLQAFGINKTFGTNVDWLIWGIIVVLISIYFLVSSGLSAKVANIQNSITLFLKVLAIICSVVIALAYYIINRKSVQEDIHWLPVAPQMDHEEMNFSYKMMPGIGLFLSWAGIFFAYDGFYVSTGIENEMKKPKDAPKVLLWGLGIVTLIHLIIAVAMSINGKGDFKEFFKFLNQRNLGWIFGIVNIFIGIGVLGIINGFSLWIPRFIEELIKNEEIVFASKLKDKLVQNKPKIGVIYSIFLIIPIVIIFIIIGGLFYPNKFENIQDAQDLISYASYGSGMSSLYNLADLLSNWLSLIIFGFIAMACFGYFLKNFKRKYKSKSQRILLWINFIISIFIMIVLFINFLSVFIDLILLMQQQEHLDHSCCSSAFIEQLKDQINGKILLIIVFFVFSFIIFVPPLVRLINYKKMFKRSVSIK
ncbi:amino acid permease [Mycoplasmopsis pullorum]|uniref:amino acid permease n=1 Tax=Mycoplasmopsis pullorum TaxID=48003 RepID=UPI0011188D19|nr:amino acid permease [Mycoplasmopsis pullorum]TNK88430.1 amino acid permease [Mycoplasmopsis pullorum]